ncbi:hypothetical protein [Methylorubrum sp. SB2]|uniref:hypothetical protein n=1 Tax=Methylorubrum subtropicum TaxID=3138812 RepID=UPI00313AB40B
MQKFTSTITDQGTGAVKALQGAQVYIYQGGSNNLATIYQDNETTGRTNPLITDEYGFVECKIPNGTYDIYVATGTIVKKIAGFCAFDGSTVAVSITMPGQFTVTGGVNVTWKNQTANTFLAGPASGSPAAPTFRKIAMADMPFTGTADTMKYLRGDGSWQNVPTAFTLGFESAEQTIENAGLRTIPHGLGVEPKLIYGVLVCKTAQSGYAVGDRVQVPLAFNGADVPCAAAVVADNQNIRVRYANNPNSIPFVGLDFSTGNGIQYTNVNWRLIIRAYA